MARRKNESFIEIFTWLFTQIPPWTCIPIAMVAYGVVATMVVSVAGSHPILKGLVEVAPLAGGGVGVLILIAGFAAWTERNRRQKLLNTQTGIESISALSWSQFELLIGQIYRQQGYEAIETGGGGADGGIDLKLRRDATTTIVQCKQWRSWKVGVGPIRELYGVMVAAGASKAAFVTSGVFTKEARAFAEGKPMELIDGSALCELVDAIRKPNEVENLPPVQSLDASASPCCPKCNGTMVMRTAKRGPNSGSQFWGCCAYPKCKGSRKAAEV